MLSHGIIRSLTATEMNYYRKPYALPAHRESLFRWPSEVPIKGSPPDGNTGVTDDHNWLLKMKILKLFF
jgi:haloalkane dehalogenase